MANINMKDNYKKLKRKKKQKKQDYQCRRKLNPRLRDDKNIFQSMPHYSRLECLVS